MKVRCWYCGKVCAVTSKNRIRKHYDPRIRLWVSNRDCAGSHTSPDTVIDRRQHSTWGPVIHTEGGNDDITQRL